MSVTSESVLRDWFDGVWNRGDEATITRLLPADARIHGLPTPDGRAIRGPQEFSPFYRAFRSAFPDINVELLHVVAQGGLAVAHCRVRGTHTGQGLDRPPTSLPVDFYGFAMCQISGEQVVEAWNCFDFLNMYRQLGADLTAPAATKAAG